LKKIHARERGESVKATVKSKKAKLMEKALRCDISDAALQPHHASIAR